MIPLSDIPEQVYIDTARKLGRSVDEVRSAITESIAFVRKNSEPGTLPASDFELLAMMQEELKERRANQ